MARKQKKENKEIVYAYQRANWSDSLLVTMFSGDQSLFLTQLIQLVPKMREMDSDFGILPYFKYDEAQQNYYTTAQDAYSTMSVMATSTHLSEVGIVFEEWNYRSYMDILPVYCEVIMKTRYLVDAESGMIFDLIRNSIKFDTGMVYGSEIDNIGTFTRSIVRSGTNTFASDYKVQERVYNNRIKQLLKYFEGRQ